MSSLKTVALGLAAVLISVVSAQAATSTKPAAHKTMHHSMHSMSHKASPATPANADRSADSLNAQSLSRAQAPQ